MGTRIILPVGARSRRGLRGVCAMIVGWGFTPPLRRKKDTRWGGTPPYADQIARYTKEMPESGNAGFGNITSGTRPIISTTSGIVG